MNTKPIGLFLIGIFLILAILILEGSGLALLMPGTFLDYLWRWQPQKYAQMLPYRIVMGITFSTLGIVFVLAVIGWFKRRKWGWWLVVAIFVVNGIGDAVGIFTGDFSGGLTGVIIAIAILFYITRPGIRRLYN